MLVGDEHRVRPGQGVVAAERSGVDDQDAAIFFQPDTGMPQLGELHVILLGYRRGANLLLAVAGRRPARLQVRPSTPARVRAVAPPASAARSSAAGTLRSVASSRRSSSAAAGSSGTLRAAAWYRVSSRPVAAASSAGR